MGFSMAEALKGVRGETAATAPPPTETLGMFYGSILTGSEALPMKAAELPVVFAELVMHADLPTFKQHLQKILLAERRHRTSGNGETFPINAETVRGLWQLVMWHARRAPKRHLGDAFEAFATTIRDAGRFGNPLGYLLQRL